jgi:hypothetical protein
MEPKRRLERRKWSVVKSWGGRGDGRRGEEKKGEEKGEESGEGRSGAKEEKREASFAQNTETIQEMSRLVVSWMKLMQQKRRNI